MLTYATANYLWEWKRRVWHMNDFLSQQTRQNSRVYAPSTCSSRNVALCWWEPFFSSVRMETVKTKTWQRISRLHWSRWMGVHRHASLSRTTHHAVISHYPLRRIIPGKRKKNDIPLLANADHWHCNGTFKVWWMVCFDFLCRKCDQTKASFDGCDLLFLPFQVSIVSLWIHQVCFSADVGTRSSAIIPKRLWSFQVSGNC